MKRLLNAADRYDEELLQRQFFRVTHDPARYLG